MDRKLFHNKIEYKHLFKHETKLHVLIKFSLVLLIFIGYFIFIAQKYGANQGFLIALLSWSFFVLCTPIADAGFLIDFPLRMVTSLRMFVAEIIVWVFAFVINIYAYILKPEIYDKTKILILFKHIIEKPFPFWIIIILSMVGTFISIKFGDELLDKVKHEERSMHQKHKNSHKLVVMVFLFAIILVLYDFFLKKLGVDLPI